MISESDPIFFYFVIIFNNKRTTPDSTKILHYLAKELCTVLIGWELDRAKPFIVGSKDWQNSLNSVSTEPSFTSGWLLLRRMLRMAWVAQALFTTYRQTNMQDKNFWVEDKTVVTLCKTTISFTIHSKIGQCFYLKTLKVKCLWY